MYIYREGLEVIDGYVFIEVQGCVYQKEFCGQAFGMDFFIFLEFFNVTQKVGVCKEYRLIGIDI